MLMRLSLLLFLVFTYTQAFSFQNESDKTALETAFTKAAELHNIKSLIVAKEGEIIHEAYFDGTNKDDFMPVRSVTKSVVSCLLGIAIDKGIIDGVQQPLLPYFPDFAKRNKVKQKEKITLEHLLTMTAGFEWDNDIESGWFNYKPNYVDFILNQPMIAAPGDSSFYNSASTHLLSLVIAKASGMSIQDFAEKHLWEPMNIKVRWELNSDGDARGSAGLRIRSRDMIKFGQLYLQKGLWEGKQIVSSNWVKTSIEIHQTRDANRGYGYLWWVNGPRPERPFMYMALGWGGQLIINIPEYKTTTVVTHTYWVGGPQSARQMQNFTPVMLDLYTYFKSLEPK